LRAKTNGWSQLSLFPNDYVAPPSSGLGSGVLLQNFTIQQRELRQANFQLLSLPSGLTFWVSGGVPANPQPRQEYFAGAIQKNVWYDFGLSYQMVIG